MDVIGSAAPVQRRGPASRFRPEAEWTISGDPTEGHWQRWLRKQAWTCAISMRSSRAETRSRSSRSSGSWPRCTRPSRGRIRRGEGCAERWPLCRDAETGWLTRAENAARHGQRVLAVARAPVPASMTDLSAGSLSGRPDAAGHGGHDGPPSHRSHGVDLRLSPWVSA